MESIRQHISLRNIALVAVTLLAIAKYEYELLKWCRATADYNYSRDLIISEDAPCRDRADIYSHRLDCAQIFRDIDRELYNSNVQRCWWDSQPLHNIGWPAIGVMLAVPLLMARWALASWTTLRQAQIEGDSMQHTLRNLGRHFEGRVKRVE